MNEHELAVEHFIYDPDSGQIASKDGKHGPWGNGKNRLVVNFHGKTVSAHRLAWLIHYGAWPEGMIDHINGDSMDNRIANLRIATYQQNNANRRGWRNSLSGVKGVTKKRGRWFAQIMVDGKNKGLGYFENVEDAGKAYLQAAKRYFGEYAKG